MLFSLYCLFCFLSQRHCLFGFYINRAMCCITDKIKLQIVEIMLFYSVEYGSY